MRRRAGRRNVDVEEDQVDDDGIVASLGSKQVDGMIWISRRLVHACKQACQSCRVL